MVNQMAQDALLRNFAVIGEASHKIETHYRGFPADHPKLPLTFAYQMRNTVGHGYFKADLEIVRRTIHRDLPRL
ncbi:MAG: HepT-like ribonuclease domain-containing protein [Accumulibacter sp.]|uniref:HepT-like ribonuclease domain-containing protein n=1 Tax=Accumulibacter sp. TaxID=2053492 RepID=UPI002FC35416